MADPEVIMIPLHLPHPEATALARLVGRIDAEDCPRFAAPCRTYDNRPEADVMWSALLTLQGALAGAGFNPR
jgi:hypothetical protein